MQIPMYWQQQYFHLSPFMRYSLTKLMTLNVLRSNANTSIKSLLATSYVFTIAIFVLSVNICNLFSQNFHELGFDLQNGPRSNVNTAFESQSGTSYVLAITMCVLSVTVYKIFIVKICMSLPLTLEWAKTKCNIQFEN